MGDVHVSGLPFFLALVVVPTALMLACAWLGSRPSAPGPGIRA